MMRFVAVAIVLAMTSVGASAKDWTEIRMATEGAYPPFNEVASDGSPKGFDVDIGNALCAEMKAKCTWVKQEWDGMIPALISRKFDAIIASMSITEERKQKVDFTNKYYSSPLGLVAKAGSKLQPTPEALKGKRVGVQRGTTQENYAAKFWEPKGVEIVRYGKQDEVYLDLTGGRLDAAWQDAIEAEGGFLRKPEGKAYGFAGPKISGTTPEEKAIIGEGIGITVRKKDQDLKEQLNKALATIRANGTYDKIMKKYFEYDIYSQ